MAGIATFGTFDAGRRSRGVWLLLLAVVCLGLLPAPAISQTVPSGFFIQNAFPTASFNLPTLIVFMPDGRKLVAEKGGKVWVLTQTGAQLATPFIDLSAKVLSNGDRGLHGVALDPDFATNRWVYFLYTADPDSNGSDDEIGAFGRLERYQTSLSNPNIIDQTTRQILIGGTWDTGIPEPPRHQHHMVGTLRFAPDKTLMVGSGDAANADRLDSGGSDPLSAYGPGRTDPAEDIGAFRARTLNSMDGKILRVDKETGLGLPSNPYWDGDGASDRSRVWVYGLRNPFRFSFRPGTGASDPTLGQPGVLYIGDVGLNTTEELSIARQGGLNLGWPCIEGGFPEPDYQAENQTYFPNPNVICSAGPSAENPAPNASPALWWGHDGTGSNPAGWEGNCAIGGVFYTGDTYPAAYRGAYFIADFGKGWIRRVLVDAADNVVGTNTFVDDAGPVVDVEADPANGDLYYIDIGSARVNRIGYSSGNLPPVAIASMNPTSGYVPLTVTATASASTDPDGDPLTYLWSFGDGGFASQADTTYTYESPGAYQATVTVSDGNGGSNLAAFNVVPGQIPPPGHILLPLENQFYLQNVTLALEAVPADSIQGPATYRWDVDLHHNTHIHPSIETRFGQATSFVPVTPSGHDGENYHLGIRLSVTQGALTTMDSVEVWPHMNLSAGSLSFNPAIPPAGTTFQVISRVRSIGEVSSAATTYQVREGPVILASGVLGTILHGDSLDVAVTIGPLSPGIHTIQFVVDPANNLFETDELDNAVSAVLAGGLLAGYAFDEGSGPTTGDASGNGITGFLSGASWAQAGKYGKALSFDGSTGYVDLDDPPQLQLTGSMTLSAWVNASANPPDDGQIIAKSNDASGWQLKTSPDTGPQTFGIAISNGAGGRVQRYSSTTRALNTWYHVAGVYDAAAQTLDIYVNGVLANGTLQGTVPTSQSSPAVNVNVGRRAGGFYFNGLIDEPRIYGRALTQAEIQADMNSPLGGPAPPPGAPVLATPADGATGVSLTPTLTWDASAGATSYRLQVSTDAGFGTLVVDQAALTGTSSTLNALVANTVYYWRVSASNSGGTSAYSAVSSFTTVAPPPPPSPPLLATPVNGATGVSLTPTLTWNASAGATSYRLQVSTDAGFGALVVDQAALTGTSSALSALVANTVYYWRVSASNAGGTSAYSAVSSFTTVTPPPPPSAPVLATPVNGATGVAVNPTLTWNASAGATSYRLQVSTSSGFGTLVADQAGLTGTSSALSSLSTNTVYYWRVSASNAGGTSAYSAVASFTTVAPPTGLLAGYAFDEGLGPTTADVSGNAITGTLSGATWSTVGKYGKALSFNGSSAYVDLGNPSQLQLLGSMTVSAWVNASANPPDDGQIVAKSNDASGWQLKTSPDTGPHTFGIAISSGTGVRVQRFSTTVRALNTWYHVAGVYNASARTLDIYVNGVLANGVLQGTVPASQGSPGAVNVNVGRRAGGYYFNGLIDEARVYARALTQAEIQADMNTPLGAPLPPPAAPVLATPVNGATGVSLTPTLTWNASSGATSYRLQVSTDAGFGTLVVDQAALTGTSSALSALVVNTVYYWRVSASNAGGTSAYSAVSNFTTVPPAPVAPVLATPVSGATGVSLTPTLTWNASAGATSYRLQVSTDVGFGTLVVDQAALTGTSSALSSLLANTVYYWRVSASNSGGTSAYSAVSDFTTVVAPPAAPVLATPVNGATGVSLTPTLTWNASSGATSYRLQVSTDAGFGTLVVDQAALTGTSSALSALVVNTVYYWRVSASNGGGTSAYSVVSNFTTVPPAPIAPVLATPVNGATGVSLTPTLTWNASAGATTYRLQVSTDTGFGTLVVDQAALTGTSSALSALAANTVYYWRVSASNSGGTSSYSAVSNFTTVAAPPAAPVLATPVNGATGVSLTPTLTWNASAGATSYRLQVSTDVGFGTLVVDQAALTGTSSALSALLANTVYYWRVSASSGGGTSAYSAVSNFTTVPPAPVAPVLATPANGATGVAVNPTLTWNASSGATSYRLQVSTSSGFGTLVVDQAALTGTSSALSSLSTNTVYYWRVSASNGGGTSAYSAVSSFTTVAPPTGLLAGYGFDEGLGPTTADVSGNAITGTLSGAAWSTVGKYGKALSFNGSNAYVDLGNPSQLQLLGSMTVSAWVNASANPPDDGQIVAKSNDATGWQLKTSPDTGPHTFGITISSGTGVRVQRFSTTVRALNTWYHVAGVYNATARTLDIYVNGVLANGVLQGTVPASQGSPGAVNVNVGRRAGGYYFNGLIDEPRVYARALTQAEIQADMNTPLGAPLPPPAAPVLATPVNGATGVALNPTLTWNASTGATSYRLQVSTSSGFGTLVVDQAGLTGTSSALSSLVANTVYYWRVSASNGGGTSVYSAVSSFTTVPPAPPAAPVLATPVNGATGVALNPTLTWNASAGATSYRLQVSTDAGFGTVVVDQAGLTGTSSGLSALLANTVYYWRVSASNSGGTSAYSAVSNFTTVPPPPPAAPVLATPASGATGLALNPTLTWNASAGATSYRLQVATDAGFGTVVVDQAALTGTSSALSALLANTVYYWRVSATNGGGTSAYSTVFNFTTVPPPPVAPVLATPASGATGVAVNPTLTWNASAGATSYRLQVATSAAFGTLIVDQAALTGTSSALSGLAANTVYYWRVSASNGGGTSSYSTVFTFTTVAPSGGLAAGYAFDEGSGTTTADVSGNGITGTLSGAAWSAVGKYGKAVSLNGTNAYVDLGNPAQLQLTGSMTISAWVNASANPFDDGQIVAKSTDASGWQLKTTPDTGPQTFGIGITSGTGSHIQRYSSTVRALNTWYHVAGVYNATARTLDIYVNGVLSNGVLLGTVPAAQTIPAVNVNVGRRTGGYYFNGLIDEVRITDRALTQAEIQADMNTPLGAPPPPPAAPVLATPVNGATGVALNPTLTWNASTGATSYRLQVSTDAGFGALVVDQAALTSTSSALSPLVANTVYYWRVSASNAGGTSAYSAVSSLTTVAPSGALVAGYAFDEGLGPTTADMSGNAITGTLSGSAWSLAGKYGKALSFNGSNAYVDLGNPSRLQLTGSMTVSAWVNASANPPDDGQIVAKSNDASGWQLKTSPDTGPHTFGITISSSTGARIQRFSTTVRALNTWYHVAGVYNAAAQTLDIYVNGVLANGVLQGTVPASQSSPAVNVNVGRRTGGYYFNGLIDEVRVFDRALTQAEVQAAMITPLGMGPSLVGVEHHDAADNSSPPQYSLVQRFSNPRASSAAMEFLLNLPVASHVKFEVFDVQGRRIGVIADENRASGSYVERFNAANLPSGVYFFRVAAGRFTGVRKVVLVK